MEKRCDDEERLSPVGRSYLVNNFVNTFILLPFAKMKKTILITHVRVIHHSYDISFFVVVALFSRPVVQFRFKTLKLICLRFISGIVYAKWFSWHCHSPFVDITSPLLTFSALNCKISSQLMFEYTGRDGQNLLWLFFYFPPNSLQLA